MAHALDTLGQPRSVMSEWLKYVRLPVEAGIRNTFGPLGLDHDTVLKAYRSFGHAEHEHLMQPFNGIPELLGELRARGQRMGVATSKRTVPLMRQMARFGWETFFDPIITHLAKAALLRAAHSVRAAHRPSRSIPDRTPGRTRRASLPPNCVYAGRIGRSA